MVEIGVVMLDIGTIVGHEGSSRDGNVSLYCDEKWKKIIGMRLRRLGLFVKKRDFSGFFF